LGGGVNIAIICTTIKKDVSPFILFLSVGNLPEHGWSVQPKHVFVYNKRLLYYICMVVFDHIIGTLLIWNTLGEDDTQNLKIAENKKRIFILR